MDSAIFIIESSDFQGQLIADMFVELKVPTFIAHSLAELKHLITMHQQKKIIAVSNLVLADAPNGEAIDLCLAHNIATVVLTSTFNDNVRAQILSKSNVIDYVIKSSQSIQQIESMLRRLLQHQGLAALVCENNLKDRKELVRLLTLLQFQVFETSTSKDAFALIKANPDIKLVISDQTLDDGDGLTFTRELRKIYNKESVCIIGLSDSDNRAIGARFIKSGANDFLSKPFMHEEFNLRVLQNIEVIQQVTALYNAANKDYLTKLFNRRYFFVNAYKQLEQPEKDCSLAMLDIDHFKHINDKFGHDAGDVILKKFSAQLSHHFNDNTLVARIGGEEFAILFHGIESNEAKQQLDNFRQAIAASPVIYNDQSTITTTVSIGLSDSISANNDLDTMMVNADHKLYQAKEAGRNCVIA